MKREPKLQNFLDKFVETAKISSDVVTGSDHLYACRCTVCKNWWLNIGPEEIDENGKPLFGPFELTELMPTALKFREVAEYYLSKQDGANGDNVHAFLSTAAYYRCNSVPELISDWRKSL